MKIKNIKINNYGNLENKNINLENKINIIYGKNESGKSTLLNYIKNIFYGISKNKNGKEISDYEKYKPWMKEEFSGKIKYELNNGEEYEIFRDFNKKNPKVFNGKMEDISKEFEVVKKEGVQPFQEHTKVDETMFTSTVVSMQQEVKLDKGAQSVLVQKLANLAGTGKDNVSFKKAIDKISKRQLEEIGTDRSQGKPINVVSKRMQEITFVLKDIKLHENRKNEIEEQKEELRAEILELENKKLIAEKINEINLENNIENEKIKIKNNLKIKNKEKIEKLNSEKNKLIINKELIIKKMNNNNFENEEINNLNNKKNRFKKEKNNKNKLIYFLIFFILLIISILAKIINIKIIKNNLLNNLVYLIIPIYLIILLIINIIQKNKNNKIKYNQELNKKINEEKIKNEIYIIDKQIENIEKELQILLEEFNTLETEINNIQKNIYNKLDVEIEKIKTKYLEKIDVDNFLEYFNIDNASEELKNIQKGLENKKILLNSIEVEEKNIIPKLESMITLKEEYKNLEEKLQELEEKNTYFNLSKEYLNKAYEKMKNNITPKFTQNLSENISKISNGKYTKVSVNDTEGLVVENEYGEYVSADRLSIGTIDQLYLSLRLSMIEEISEEKMPIILDEAFAYYDDSRLENILEYLANKLNEHQLIIFTCTKREQEILSKLGIPYNLVEL